MADLHTREEGGKAMTDLHEKAETPSQVIKRIYAEMDLSPEACETIAEMYEEYPVALYIRALSARLAKKDAALLAAERVAQILADAIHEHDTADHEWNGTENPWTMREWFDDGDRAALAALRAAMEDTQ